MKKVKNNFASTVLAGFIFTMNMVGYAQSESASRLVANEAIRPFQINVPQADLDELRQRLLATRWPDQETVTDQSQGIELDKLRGLVDYWVSGYDWRKTEAKLNVLTDSPVGLAAWIYDYNNGQLERVLAKDDVLDDITLYWLTNSAASTARLYWETSGQSVLLASAQRTNDISLPVAITVFPDEVYQAPETWARSAYPNLIYFHEAPRGSHFAAWEQPQLFAEELRTAFRSFR